jgi:hypothetical protein
MLSSDQEQSSASGPPPLPRLIWFLLVDSETGEPYKNSSVSSILHSLITVPVIDQFRDAVHRENSCILNGIAPSQLVVYKNKAAFDGRNNAEDQGKEQPLDPTESIGVLGSTKDMLVVAVPCLIKEPSRKRKQAKQSRFWYLLVDSETGELYKRTTADAVSLSTGAFVAQFRDAVHLENSCILTGIDPFNLLVYKNNAAFAGRNNAQDEGKEQPLKSSRNLDGLGESEEEALVVVVPPPSQPPYYQYTQTQSFPPCQLPFFNSIPTITERDGWISFGEEEIPSTSLNSLYIRECYIKYYSSQWHSQGNHQWYPRDWQVPLPHLPLVEIG